MATFIEDIKLKYSQGNALVKLIFINISVFLLLNVVSILFKLFNIESLELINYVAIPSSPGELLLKPWTILTYMFAHYEILHILFNMLILYWFGNLFLDHFSERQAIGLYILGGLAGAAIYLIAFNYIPLFLSYHSTMLGASASVMAIVFGISFYRPNTMVNLWLIGGVKIVYIALVMFAIDFISLDDMANPGGHVAHIGGASVGYLFAYYIAKGRDISSWINKVIDFVVNTFTFRKKNKMKVVYSRKPNDYKYNEQRRQQEANIDAILDKIKQSGYDSLSSNEKKKLFDASKK